MSQNCVTITHLIIALAVIMVVTLFSSFIKVLDDSQERITRIGTSEENVNRVREAFQ
jgi:hypothetical protein